MIFSDIISTLTAALDVPVAAEKPEPQPETYVTVEQTGRAEVDKSLYVSTFAIQSYAPRKLAAALLSAQVCEAMGELIKLDDVTGVELNNEYDFTDVATRRYRYQAIFDVTHY